MKRPRTEVATTEAIRKHFPALERTHAGEPVAYFDGPGGTQVPRQVVDAMTDYLYEHNANTHWVYPSSVETDAMIENARVTMADFLNAESEEISFGNNMTTITFHLARALARQWNAGDAVVVTELDHHANVAPWREIARERGLVLETVRMRDDRPALDTAHFTQVLRQTPRVRLVAFGAASNAVGSITDVAHAVNMAHSVGALAFVDAVHYAPHELVDVRKWDCDFLACSAYKFHGPHVGVLYGKYDHVAQMEVPRIDAAPDTVPERLETGTQNHEGIVGAAAAVDFLASMGVGASRRERLASTFEALHRCNAKLLERLWAGLYALPGVRIHGLAPDAERTPTIAFTVRDMLPDDVARRLVERGVFVSSGDFYATTVMERLGHARHGVVRAGCACYTSEEEVDRMLAGMRELVRNPVSVVRP
ncbi:MAG TPA: cysteine desulfurase-like protein [Gemmatimonadaceae bacterium]|nr:cysteine desulfurase-like protein [Gemmatimonadaceae bacterium]